AGSRGVYLINRFSDIIDVKRRKRIDSWEALKRQMIRDIKSDWVEEDQWIIEEIIFEDAEKTIPASDVKFYCFYGKVGIILEITRFPELKYSCSNPFTRCCPPAVFYHSFPGTKILLVDSNG